MSFCSFKLKCGECGGYLDNFKILSNLTLTFNCGFPHVLALEKIPKTSRFLINLPNLLFIVVWRFTLFCPLRGDVYQGLASIRKTYQGLDDKTYMVFYKLTPFQFLYFTFFQRNFDIATLLYILFCLYFVHICIVTWKKIKNK